MDDFEVESGDGEPEKTKTFVYTRLLANFNRYACQLLPSGSFLHKEMRDFFSKCKYLEEDIFPLTSFKSSFKIVKNAMMSLFSRMIEMYCK